MITFPHAIKINNIIRNLPPNTCGSASASIIFEKLELDYDPLEFVKSGRDGNATATYPVPGSNIFGTALAMAKTGLVEVEIYVDFNLEKEYDDVDEYEKPILDELKSLNNYIISSPISIDKILDQISDECIPILAFNRDGNPNNGHFSPLRGLNGGEILMLPLEDAIGSCHCEKNKFVEEWWTGQVCIMVRKK